ncbi:hypothetical protein Golob_028130 [Gossypium lobatum]|uniref:Reverse transcriptase zinc-binding domain-containing protein n=1 Tax=Gossypium lobatum TaxID=34289 RepID=A0A7J8NJN1_9ROSI|nr:hypothetical protein [Gossypium lobatum]
MLPKIKVFSWRVGHEILHTYKKISLCQQNFVVKCPRCEAKEETFIHALKDCPSARAILTFGGLDNQLIKGNYSWCIDWLEDILRVMDLKAAADFFTLLWNYWNSRNNFIFNGKEDDARGVWERAKNLSRDFRIHNLVYMLVIPAASIHKTWIKSLKGFIKINFVAALSNTMMGFGVIARDEDGFAISGSSGYKDCSLQAE